jgi:hypothetical protein
MCDYGGKGGQASTPHPRSRWNRTRGDRSGSATGLFIPAEDPSGANRGGNTSSEGGGPVPLLDARDRKYPNASREWRWQWVFLQEHRGVNPRAGENKAAHLTNRSRKRPLSKGPQVFSRERKELLKRAPEIVAGGRCQEQERIFVGLSDPSRVRGRGGALSRG